MNKPRSMTNAQAAKLIRRLEYRDQLLIRLAIQSGLRVSDILKIKNGDIKKSMTIFESKSKRDRTFKIDDELYQDLKKFTKYKKKASYCFHSSRQPSKSIHRSAIHRRIKKALQGLKFEASAHSTRKLYAHNVFAETHSLKKVQEAMNHRSILTTLSYLDIEQADIEKIMLQNASGGI